MSEWKEYKVEDVAEVVGGGTPKTSETEFWNGDIAWLTKRFIKLFRTLYL